jgi:hypothetical protein
MIAECAKTFVVMAALAALPAGLSSQTAPSPSTQTATASNPQSQSTPPAKPKPKKPEEPIDPDATAGVRGPGTTHTIRVLLKGKPAVGAHVVVRNTNGTLAASCDTSDTGECQVDVGADSYVIGATRNGRVGTVSMPVSDSTGPIVIKLAKVKADSTIPKPQTP